MMRITRSLSVLVVVLSAFGCDGGDRQAGQFPLSRDELERNAPTDDPAEHTYRRYCIGCHGADGRGNGGVTGADFTRADGPFAQKPDAELVLSVRDGRRGTTATMPAHAPVLRDEQIAAVVAYARKRFAPAAAVAQPAPEAPAAPAAPAPSATP